MYKMRLFLHIVSPYCSTYGLIVSAKDFCLSSREGKEKVFFDTPVISFLLFLFLFIFILGLFLFEFACFCLF